MTQEESIQSKRQEVWTRMYTLLDLNPGGVRIGGRGRVLMAVRPVISVDELLRETDVQQVSSSVGVGVTVFFTVPDGEQWYWLGYSLDRTSGDRDNVSVSLVESPADGGTSFFPEMYTGVAERRSMFARPIRLKQGWVVRANFEGGTTDGNWIMKLLIEKVLLSP